MNIIVGTTDLRRALLAVLPHVHVAGPDDETDLARVRLIEGDVNLTCVATDAHTTAAAIVSIWEGNETSGEIVDLGPDTVKKILAVHKPVKTRSQGDEFEPEQSLALSTEHGTDGAASLVTRDVSGLFPGDESLSVPILDQADRFPDVAGYLGEAVHGHVSSAYDGQPVALPHEWLARFGAAAKTYKAPLAARLIGQDRYRLLITVGDSFIGLASLTHPVDQNTPDQETVMTAWDQWRSRLPERMERNVPDDKTVEASQTAGDAVDEVKRDRPLHSVE